MSWYDVCFVPCSSLSVWHVDSVWLEDRSNVGVIEHSARLEFREDELVIDEHFECTCLEQASLDLAAEEESADTVHPRAFLKAFDGFRDGLSESREHLVTKPDHENERKLRSRDEFGEKLVRFGWGIFPTSDLYVRSLRFDKSLDLNEGILVSSSYAVEDVNLWPISGWLCKVYTVSSDEYLICALD